jgi:hypothetical protein
MTNDLDRGAQLPAGHVRALIKNSSREIAGSFSSDLRPIGTRVSWQTINRWFASRMLITSIRRQARYRLRPSSPSS